MTIYYPPGTGGGLLASDPGNSLWAAGHVETTSRYVSNGELTIASGTATFGYFTAPAACTITKLGVSTGGTAAASITAARIALFTVSAAGDLTKVAQIAAQSTNFANATYADFSYALATAGGFPASYMTSVGQRYAMGIVQVGTTPCVLRVASVINFAATAPLPNSTIISQTDLSATYTAGSLTNSFQIPYLYGV